jgi:cell division protein FtsB
MFGLGWSELLLLGMLAILAGVPIIGVAVYLATHKASSSTRRDELADLRAEVRQLRDEVEHLKSQMSKNSSEDGILPGPPK